MTLPSAGTVVRIDPRTLASTRFPFAGHPRAVVSPGVWVAASASHELARLDGTGSDLATTELHGTPTAIAVVPANLSAWVTDAGGAITHVAADGSVLGQPTQVNPAATAIWWGDGSAWATNGTTDGLIRITPSSGSTTAFNVGPDPLAVTVDRGVWTAHADGHVTRFNPNRLRVNADLAVAPELDAIAARDGGIWVWAISASTKTLYRISNTGTPAVTGTVVFGSEPLALTATTSSVWVATANGELIQIRL